jgi:hypothetical protein
LTLVLGAIIAPIVELFSDLACPTGFLDYQIVVVLEHDFYKPFDAIVTERVEELARVRANLLVLNEIQLKDGCASRVCALADKGDELIFGSVDCRGSAADLFVRSSKRRVIVSDTLSGHRVHVAPSLSYESGRAQEAPPGSP